MKGVRDGDEVRGLVGAVDVDRACEDARLVGDHRDRMTAETGEHAHHRRPELGLDLERRRLVEHHVDDVAHLVHPPAVAGHDLEHLGNEARLEVAVDDVGRIGPRRRREIPQVPAHEVERILVVGRGVVDQPARDRDRRTAEVFLRDRLPERLEHHRRTGGEDRPVLAHHREVGHRRHQRAVPGRCAEHRGDQRHAARAARLREEIGRRARVHASVGAETCAFQHHHERHLVGDGDLGNAVALRVARLADRARLHGEVLGGDHHRATVDATRAHDDRVGGKVGTAHERAELLERPRIEEVVDACTRIELPGGAVLGESLLAAHEPPRDPTVTQITERRFPVVGAETIIHVPAPPHGPALDSNAS